MAEPKAEASADVKVALDKVDKIEKAQKKAAKKEDAAEATLEDAPEAKEAASPPEEDPVYCPRCQFNIKQREAECSDEERKEYVRAMLGSRLFSKQYELFDGKMKLTFTSLPNSKAEEMAKVLRLLDRNSPTFIGDAHRVKALYYLSAYNDVAFEVPEKEFEDYEHAHVMFTESFEQFSEDQMTIIMRALAEFQNLLALLAQSAFDENFWKGAGLA